jgi:hypothetical protein
MFAVSLRILRVCVNCIGLIQVHLFRASTPNHVQRDLRADRSIGFSLDLVIGLSHKIGVMHVQTRGPRSARPNFDRLLVESLDESFAAILGEIPKKTVYDVLQKNHAIAKNCIPERLNEFTAALETVFGAPSSKVLERIIVKGLYSKLGLTYVERPDWRLFDYVAEARSKTTLFDGAILAL